MNVHTTKEQTAMAAALMRSGVEVGKAALYSLAARLLHGAGRNPLIAHDSFVEALERDEPMVCALVGREEISRRSLEYLKGVAAEMTARRRGGHASLDAHGRRAPASHSDDDGQSGFDTQALGAASSEPHSDGEGQTLRGAQVPFATSSEPNRAGGSQRRRGDQLIDALAGARPGNAKRGLASIASVQPTMARSIMDTIKIDGRAIGDWTIGEALTAGREKARHASVLLAVGRRYANADPFAKVRDVLKVAELQRIVQKAAEVSDAA